MKYLFDSSAIFTALMTDSSKVLSNYTLDLARYELGNIIWKEFCLHKRLDSKQHDGLIDLIPRVMRDMTVLSVEGREGRVGDLAAEFRISFYDASYVHCAKELGLELVTEDDKLIKKIGREVAVHRLNGI